MRRDDGFSLIEVLVVLAIVAILAGLSAPQIMNALKVKQKADCAMARIEVQNAERQYAVHYAKPSAALEDLRSQGYLKTVPSCPGGGAYLWINDATATNPFRNLGCSIHYFPVAAAVTAAVSSWPQKAVAYWPVNDGTGLTLRDPKGLNNGAIIGARWVNGKNGMALRFNGKGDYVHIADNPALDLRDAGTLAVWFKMEEDADFAGLIHKGDKKDFSDEAYSLQFWNNEKIRLALVDESGKTVWLDTNKKFESGQWYNVVATWDREGLKIYVNGELDAGKKAAVTVRNTAGGLNIGAQLSETYSKNLKNLPFNGIIDEVAVHNKALGAEEIRKYYLGTL
jgi:prepilin-type N-terminal cleavage/methylation domain-containing protein